MPAPWLALFPYFVDEETETGNGWTFVPPSKQQGRLGSRSALAEPKATPEELVLGSGAGLPAL